jgi:tripeptidyl-peptidase-1
VPEAVPSSCSSQITPACLQAIYGLPTTAATSGTANGITVSGYIEQYAQKADLTSFLKKYRTDASSTATFTLQTIDGGSNPQSASDAGIEADLDVEYTVGVATGVPVYFLSVGDSYQDGGLEGFLDTVNYISSSSVKTYVLTTSYGQNENTISRALAVKLCNAYASIGTKGVSVLFASGDGGVSGSQSASCSKFVATFPVSFGVPALSRFH